MAPIVNSVEIERSPEEVFAYLTDLSRFTEWQEAVVSARPLDDAPMRVGSRATMTRRVGKSQQTMTSELTAWDPPRNYAFRVIDGPVRAVGTGTLEPIGNGDRTRLTFELDFEGHGIGKLLIPLFVRKQARAEMLENHRALKEQLESGAA